MRCYISTFRILYTYLVINEQIGQTSGDTHNLKWYGRVTRCTCLMLVSSKHSNEGSVDEQAKAIGRAQGVWYDVNHEMKFNHKESIIFISRGNYEKSIQPYI